MSNEPTRDREADEAGERTADVDSLAVTSSYKVLGEDDLENGVAVLGQNNADSGTPIGVKGVVNATGGFGLDTPDDLRVGGQVWTDSPFEMFVGGDRSAQINTDNSNGEAGNVVFGHASNNALFANAAFIGGGGYDDGTTSEPNVALGKFPTVCGGRDNRIENTPDENYDTIGGGRGNKIASANGSDLRYATIAGGRNNELRAPDDGNTYLYDTISGGRNNTIKGGARSSTIGGGERNDVEGADKATIAGGIDHNVSGKYATVGGGLDNDAGGTTGGTGNDQSQTIAGGAVNRATAQAATVGGGQLNKADGSFATVPGGRKNRAQADYAFAAGRRAKAKDPGTFVWADSTKADFASSNRDRFLVRASNGARVTADNTGETFSSLSEYAMLVENLDSDSSNMVLGLKTGVTAPPSSSNTFVQFMSPDGNGGLNANGVIEGNGAGGVSYETTGSDYAEYLPLLDPEETVETGDVVGVVGGAVTKRTDDAARLLVVSDAPSAVGNSPDPGADDHEDHEVVAFTGQVPVKVRGPVADGDLVVPSGDDDGTAEAIDPGSWRPGTPVVGQAWEDDDGEGVSEVTVAVGIDDPTLVGDRMAEYRDRIDDLEAENEELRERLAEFERRLTAVEPGPADSPSPADD